MVNSPKPISGPGRYRLAVGAAGAVLWVAAGLGMNGPSLAADAEPAADALEEVVVSARKREERLQDVPIAVTAIGSDEMQRAQIVNLQNFNFVVPSVSISAPQGSQNGAAVFVRGIGQDNSTIMNESGVGVYVDGVYVARQIGAMLDLIDLDHIEVLRGPQGTLYGRNNLGGAIKVESRRPDFDGVSYKADATVGSFQRVDLRAAFNVPLSDNIAMTASLLSRNDNGYYKHALTGADLNRKDTQAARLGLMWKFGSDASLYVSADYTRDRSGLQVGTPFTSSDPKVAVPVYGYFAAAPALPDLNRYSGEGISATFDWGASFGRFTSITAFRKINYVQADDLSATPYTAPANFPFPTLKLTRTLNHKQVSQELQFNSSWKGPVSLTAGLYYFREQGLEDLGFVLAENFSLPFIADQVSRSYAAYAEASYAFTDQLALSVGGRYTKDNKDLKRSGVFAGINADDSNSNFTPRVILSFKPDVDTMVYASFSRGYQEGEYQPFPGDLPSAGAITKPQEAKAYELGAKSEWLDRRLRTNLSLFRNEYTDLAIGVRGNGNLVEQTSADVRVQGAELEVSARLSDRLSLSGYLAKIDSKYTKAPGGANNPQVGDQQKNTPPFSGRVALDYQVPLADEHGVDMGLAYTYSDTFYPLVPNLPWYEQKSYGLLDARIGYRDDRNHWSVELAGKNLSNERYFQQATLLSGPMKFFMPERTWSLTFRIGSR